MALITGSTTIDWSTVSLDLVNYQAQFDALESRLDSVVANLNSHQYMVTGRGPTFVSLILTSVENAGARLTIRGEGFGGSSARVTSFNYRNPATGDVFRVSGSFDSVGNEVFTGFTLGTSGLEARFAGRIVVDASGNIVSGTVTTLQGTVGGITFTMKGRLVIDSDFNFVGGTVTQIAVVSGANTILMTGLSLPYSVLDPATTADDCFTLIGSQLSGNDTLLYTNNSGTGMSFSGGAGNDRITVLGSNGDTLDGGIGNDILNGGAGDDTLLGGDGKDVFVIRDASEHGVGEVITGGADDDVIRFTSTTLGQTLVLAPGVTEVERVAISTASGNPTGTTLLNVDASAVTSGLTIVGNAGANKLTGTAFSDVLIGNAGNDEIEGQDGSDILNGGAGRDGLEGGDGNDLLNGGLGNDNLMGGLGDDTYVIGVGTDVLTENLNEGTDTVESSVTHTLGANFENLTLIGAGAINGTGNELANVIMGNNAANILTGGDGNDTLAGNSGNDKLDGGMGNDSLNGGAGYDRLAGGVGDDTYQINHGSGQDRIVENDDTPGNSDSLVYNSAIDPADLILSRRVNDLRIAVQGTTDRVTIVGWYADPDAAQVETIQAGNGQTLLNSQVDQLIQAMAQFTADNNGVTWDQAAGGAGDQAQFQAILAASWQA